MKKQVRNFNPNLVLVIMVILCTIASYFVTPGAYDRETVNGITRVVATSYHEVARTPVSVMRGSQLGTFHANAEDADIRSMHNVILFFAFMAYPYFLVKTLWRPLSLGAWRAKA